MNIRRVKKVLCGMIPVKSLRKKVSKAWNVCNWDTNHYGTRFIYFDEVGSEKIYRLLMGDAPCMITRFGSTELYCTNYFYQRRNDPCVHFDHRAASQMVTNAGFFPLDHNLLTRYCCETIGMLPHIDIMAVCNFSHNRERDLLEKYAPQAQLIGLGTLCDVADAVKPWTRALRGKKVLVVYPFAKSIELQYQKRELIFPGHPDILPEFELKTIKAVQSLGDQHELNDGRFKNWFEALDYMCGEIDKVDFDIALIGAGAYGMFLADHVKKIGKKAVHLGGQTQFLFGIKGARWGNHRFLNDAWVSPLPEETPKSLKTFASSEGNTAYW